MDEAEHVPERESDVRRVEPSDRVQRSMVGEVDVDELELLREPARSQHTLRHHHVTVHRRRQRADDGDRRPPARVLRCPGVCTRRSLACDLGHERRGYSPPFDAEDPRKAVYLNGDPVLGEAVARTTPAADL